MYGSPIKGKNAPPLAAPDEVVLPESRPLFLSDSVSVSAGATQPLATERLTAPAGEDIAIREIRFSLHAAGAQVQGGHVGVRFQLMKAKDVVAELCADYVPAWLFGKGDRLQNEFLQNPSDTVPPTDSYAEYSWRLAYPLYVPAGYRLSASAHHFGVISQAIDARISYGAQTISHAHKPNRAMVPWVASYRSKGFDPHISDSDSSTDLQIVNTTGATLRAQHFVGRLVIYQSTFSTSTLITEFLTGSVGNVSNNMTVKITDSDGTPVIKNAASFREAFSGVTRTWETNHEVEPGKYYIADLSYTGISPGGTAIANSTLEAGISLVGYREVSL